MNVVHPIASYPPYGDGAQPPQGQYPPQYGSPPPAGGGYPPQVGSTGPGTGSTPVYPYQGAPTAYYAPPGAAYPPYNPMPGQGGAYPTQQGAYPTQQGAYPTQQGAYPAQQGAYPAQQGYPSYPPYPTGQQAPQPMMAGAPYQPYSTTPSSPPYGMQPPPGYQPQYGIPPMDATGAHMNPLPGLQPLAQYPPVTNQSAIPKPGSEHSTTGSTSQFTMREWSVGLCSCSTHCIPNCFMPWCCPCVSLAQIYARIGLASYRVALIRFSLLIASGVLVRFIPLNSRKRRFSGTATTLDGTAWYLFLLGQQIVLFAAIAIARRRVRQRFKIPGNRCTDVLISCLCPCCTIA